MSRRGSPAHARAPRAARCLVALALAFTANAARAEPSLPPGHVAVLHGSGPPPPLVVAREKPPPLFWGFHVDGGVASVSGLPLGGYGRIGSEMFSAQRKDHAGPIAGVWGAWEAWGAPGSWGLALPLVVFAGFQTPVFFSRLGAGLNVFTVDRIHRVTGVGVFSPRAQVRLGFNTKWVEFGVEADVQHRWQWRADDRTILSAGVFVALLGEEGRPPTVAAPR